MYLLVVLKRGEIFMFVDIAKIYVKAGDGGDGIVAFRREKYVPAGGPAGGDGGKGGDVIFVADRELNTLLDFKYKRHYKAQNGERGGPNNMHGKDGEDLIIKVPVGTVIKDAETGEIIADLSREGDRAIVAHGGRGGRGNAHFATSTRQVPRFAEVGEKGDELWVILELKVLADVGLIGYPNVGKSTFLSVATNARPEIANYPFTTKYPNLGIVYISEGESFVLADIPGLIEGASEGAGLGHQFLRHVERTKVLIHIVDVSGSEGREPVEDFIKINEELKKYSPELAQKPQIVAANKMDLPDAQAYFELFKEEIEKMGYKVYPVSAATGMGVREVLKRAYELLKQQKAAENVEEDAKPRTFVYYKKKDVKPLTIRKENGVYVVEGTVVEKVARNIVLNDHDSFRYFQNFLNKLGVFDKLREMGIQDGDIVRILDVEFEYYE
ncbi:GTPase obg [Caldicellulosiruptor acetigenus 6A]|uniref:GTPase Obg n=2 Tax=Caldicellulosiruptor acetigenus TaxID=301953 RepID=G2PYW4_9FIRM|nr:GTPase obg [Caldicellulosiruptor acetigenus 6A]